MHELITDALTNCTIVGIAGLVTKDPGWSISLGSGEYCVGGHYLLTGWSGQ